MARRQNIDTPTPQVNRSELIQCQSHTAGTTFYMPPRCPTVNQH